MSSSIQSILQNTVDVTDSVSLHSISDFEDTFVAKRGLDIQTQLNSFFNPSILDLHDPFLFPQMDVAVERILRAKENAERIVIFGDYDVDGVSSTAMLLRFFAMIGIQVSYRIPHRSKDGYGMKPYFFDDLAEKNVQLVISVDCGTRDIDTIKYAKTRGIDVIVTDHHAVPESIPEEAIAIITPKLPGTSYPFSGLSGSGTAFKLLSAVASRLYHGSEYERIVLSFSDFAALGTVADMVPLVGENRTIVQLGLAQIEQSRSPGLRKMVDGKDTKSADCIGFQIGPRINAAGRMDHANIALQALICSDTKTGGLLDQLENLNLLRRKSTLRHFEAAESCVDMSRPVLIHSSRDIEHGVIGLVAGRLSEKYKKPSIVCKIEEGLIFGSARSQEGYNITDGLTRVSQYLKAFGGHAQAAGFSMEKGMFDDFMADICLDVAKNRIETESGFQDASKSRYLVDYIVSIERVDIDLIDVIEKYGPYGMKYKKPLFLVHADTLPRVEYLGSTGEHLRFVYPGYSNLKIQGFGIGEYLERIQAMQGGVGFLCEIQRETWKGRASVSLMIQDIVEWNGALCE